MALTFRTFYGKDYLFSRKVVGWSMKSTMATCLVRSALQMALLQRKPAKGLLRIKEASMPAMSTNNYLKKPVASVP